MTRCDAEWPVPLGRISLPPVLMYHSISPSDAPDPFRLRVHPTAFNKHLQFIRRLGLRGVPLGRLLDAHRRGEARGLIGLTFDDGYADFFEHALPVLQSHDMVATVYVVAGRLGGVNDWDAGPRLRLLNADELRLVAEAGHEVGSHTLTHARLVDVDEETLRLETLGSRSALEATLQKEVTSFCYPYGSFDAGAVKAVMGANYDHACVTGDYSLGNQFAIPRCYVSPTDTALHLAARLTRHHLRQWSAIRRAG